MIELSVLHVGLINEKVLQTKKCSLYDWLMLSTVLENVPSCTAWFTHMTN